MALKSVKNMSLSTSFCAYEPKHTNKNVKILPECVWRMRVSFDQLDDVLIPF